MALLLQMMSSIIRAETADRPAVTEAPELTQLRLASTNWCPYVCGDPARPGFIHEYLKTLLAAAKIELSVEVLPWSRAIGMAEKGHFDGLLTATRSEAPDFLFPTVPTGYYQMCFYTRPDSTLVYRNRSSLAGQRLGIISDYGYGEPIDSMISAPLASEVLVSIANSNPLMSLIGMLNLHRIDLFIEDRSVVHHFQLQNKMQPGEFREAGCLKKIPFYTALSPNFKHRERMVNQLNTILGQDDALKFLNDAQHRYQAISKI
ncbi:MAG: transporter substrate-binding domain-containing protein [Pseudomonadales bacterium]|nr:transporter substrate-binding domain-containing protein [Pseudomonadales bacterium]